MDSNNFLQKFEILYLSIFRVRKPEIQNKFNDAVDDVLKIYRVILLHTSRSIFDFELAVPV